jgi:hypothetical protein
MSPFSESTDRLTGDEEGLPSIVRWWNLVAFDEEEAMRLAEKANPGYRAHRVRPVPLATYRVELWKEEA